MPRNCSISPRIPLRDWQDQFMDALLDERAAGPLAGIAGNGLAPEARLRVYRRSCNEIQTAALRTSYPAVLALVGQDWFDQTARAYRRAYPSASGNLQAFGLRLSDLLETLPACRTFPYLPDVARLEWLRQQTILAAESASITRERLIQALGNADSPLKIALHPSVHCLESRHPILTIWNFAMQPDPGRLDLGIGGESVMLWRADEEVAMVALRRADFECVETMVSGGSLQEACERAVVEDAEFDLGECLSSLLQHGLVTGIGPFAIAPAKV